MGARHTAAAGPAAAQGAWYRMHGTLLTRALLLAQALVANDYPFSFELSDDAQLRWRIDDAADGGSPIVSFRVELRRLTW